MIRLIGILTGSAIAIAMLLLVLGVPELAERPEPVDHAAEPSVNEALVEAKPEPAAAPPTEPAPEPEPLTSPRVEPATELPVEPATELPVEPGTEVPVEPVPETLVAADQPSLETEPSWYAFWSPFRSRIAADGFISELSRTTGFDYRVVKLKPGIYEVAFAYKDDADIQDKLERISAATGLDMTGG